MYILDDNFKKGDRDLLKTSNDKSMDSIETSKD